MGSLYLVRHGQASLGADDYDVLSALGQRQALRLGEHFHRKGLVFDAAYTGTLRRQRHTFDGICQGLGMRMTATADAGLDEYNSHALIEAVHPQPLEKPTTPDSVRSHFRLLKPGLAHWMAGATQPRGMPSYSDFVKGVTAVLDLIRQADHANVLLVSSGGPISSAVSHVLGTSPEATVELNLRIRNTSVTEFAFTPKRHMLVTFNTLPHLDAPEYASWVTYA